jgi:hypothetical protein
VKEPLILAVVAALLAVCLPHTWLLHHSDLTILGLAVFAIVLKVWFVKKEGTQQ